MNFKYQVELLEMKEVHELPNAWTSSDLVGLLNHIDFDDADSITPEELREMTGMALSDFDVEEASDKVLEFRLGDRLNKGQRQNLVDELQDDRIWEEYSDLAYHKELFNVCCMLYWGFPKKFSEPDIVKIKLKIISQNNVSDVNLKTLTPSFVARLLNDGMDNHNIIYRLFDEQIASNKFEESEHIIWELEEDGFNPEDRSNTITIHTSWNWVDELKGVKSYESTAFSDGQLN
ncbi:hypothetical protein [Ekhidna sp.]|uniref:hypothetical protein n=1 Tax=Ekhidna sp. TaxID=2608089 RepID=UPI0032EEF711